MRAARSPLHTFLAASPWPQRLALSLLLQLVKRPRGKTLLRRLAPLDQLAGGLAGLGHYDSPAVAAPLGWDAEAVASRGRELRRAEGRP